VWGTDEISWFANCSEEYRNSWLVYAADWLKANVPRGYMSMPGVRTATVPLGSPRQFHYYRFNNKSEACPNGFNQEDTVKEILARPFEWLPLGSVKSEKTGKKELLGFRPGKATLPESFRAAYYTDNTEYTDEGLTLLYRAYGGFSPADVAAAAKKEIEEKGAPRKEPLLTPEGLHFAGSRTLSLSADTGSEMSLFVTLRLDNAAFSEDFIPVSLGEYMGSGVFIKYFGKDDELCGEINDGSGKRRIVVFPYPKDEKVHSIGLVADGSSLTAWFDGKLCDRAPAGSMIPGSSSLVLGADTKGCLIKDIRLYNYAVSEAEALRLSRVK
jgi:hypothetical protein